MAILNSLLGLHLDARDLTWIQMSARAVVVFVWGIILVRCGDRRLLGRNASFDMLLVIVLGSVLSRAINGQAAFLPTLGVSAVLVFLHHVLAVATLHSSAFSRLVKGRPHILVQDGKPNVRELRRAKFTRDDLDENLRLNGCISDLNQVREARLERDGSVSVVAVD